MRRSKKHRKRKHPFLLKQVCLKAGVSLGELSRRTGLNASLLTDLAGGYNRPSWATFVKIAEAVGFDLTLFTQPWHEPGVGTNGHKRTRRAKAEAGTNGEGEAT